MSGPTHSASVPRPVGMVAGLTLLTRRGILLWIAIPVGFVAWIILSPWVLARGVPLGQFLGWIDLNLVAGLERTVLRPLFRHPLPWVSVREIATVHHRVGKLDPV